MLVLPRGSMPNLRCICNKLRKFTLFDTVWSICFTAEKLNYWISLGIILLTRYTTDKKGKSVKLANVYTLADHGIAKNSLDKDVIKVTNRLESSGYRAYIVGGAVRDLLLGKIPKDIDIATDAKPNRVRKLFRNSRIIGRRFRLVHIFFDDKIFEISTFRSEGEDHLNEYGTIEEDVIRRDFTMNALYYSPSKEQIIDYVGGYEDIKAGRIVSLIPLETTFQEDPVRMIRAIKYSAITGFGLSKAIRNKIRKDSEKIALCSRSRLTEEMMKILRSGVSQIIMKTSYDLGVLRFLVPTINTHLEMGLDGTSPKTLRNNFFSDLEELDKEVKENSMGAEKRKFVYLTKSFLENTIPWEEETEELYRLLFTEMKRTIKPLTPPNANIEDSVRWYLRGKNLRVPKRRYHPAKGGR